MVKKDVFQYALAVLIVLGFSSLTIVLFIPAVQDELPTWVSKNMSAVFVAWILNFNTVVQYFFGSSKGSNDKTELLKNKSPDVVNG